MSKQVMNINVLAEFITNSFGASNVLVEINNRIITIEPILTDNSDSANPGTIVNKTKAGALKLDDFKDIRFSTKNFKFDREEANKRR
ncbi:MAG: hypothetical protein LBS60_12030 [Deltaproteobacteria bacterium]|jgi:hypothetical protein|nr:hypothetical protein [Deltaproteobacteria bacterium]